MLRVELEVRGEHLAEGSRSGSAGEERVEVGLLEPLAHRGVERNDRDIPRCGEDRGSRFGIIVDVGLGFLGLLGGCSPLADSVGALQCWSGGVCHIHRRGPEHRVR